ncbi:hypothetical protein B0H19DRAFT_1367402 [Mycena capillaripes]|nr:hypothetical protein B0H19DRAFT_1367402 [Mycena capillaripes]
MVWHGTAIFGKMSNLAVILASWRQQCRISQNRQISQLVPAEKHFPDATGGPTLTNQDWILVPQDTNTFKIQSAPFPDMFISYAGIGIPATTPIHSQLVLRGNANAAIFSLRTVNNGTTVNLLIPAINKAVRSWAVSTDADKGSPYTITNFQTGIATQNWEFLVVA